MTINEFQELRRKKMSKYIANTEGKQDEENDINKKPISKEQTENKETEEKPREIKIRFIKKVN